jgi:hypothetical protein
MRKYIRHPSDIPIEFDVQELSGCRERLRNISLGGVAFTSTRRLPIGSAVEISIPVVDPTFRARARVAWCLTRKDCFDVGVQFVDEDDAFRARMVEQLCHIEHYKREVLAREGRPLSGEEAAMEWIGKFAGEFPGVGAP